jgi:hypothetical protein
MQINRGQILLFGIKNTITNTHLGSLVLLYISLTESENIRTSLISVLFTINNKEHMFYIRPLTVLPPRGHGFYPSAIHVGFVVEKRHLYRILSLQVRGFSSVSIISQWLKTDICGGQTDTALAFRRVRQIPKNGY